MLTEIVKQKHTEARRSGDKISLSVLSVLLGEIQNIQFAKGRTTDVTDEEVIKIVKKIMEGNSETLLGMMCEDGDEYKFSSVVVEKENQILSGLLPSMATQEQIRGLLESQIEAIKAAKNSGQARGVAIKYLRTLNVFAESKDVIEVVEAMYKE
jgi:hypothetical protein